MENLLRMGMRRTSIAPALLTGVAIAAAGFTLAPTPAAAFVCGEVGGGGDGASASPGGTACGTSAQAPGLFATAVGVSAGAWGSFSTALGVLSDAGGNSTDLGSLDNFNATAIGSNASAGTTAAGQYNATALGADSSANALNATALGAGATANFANSTAIGQDVSTTRDNQVAIGAATNTYTLAGINSQASKDAQAGTTYMMTTDADGDLASSSFTTQQVGNAITAVADHEIRITANTNDIAGLDGRVGALESDFGALDSRIDKAFEGTAMALAMAGSSLPSDKNFAVSINWGVFEGENAFAGTAHARINDNLFVHGGLGVGAGNGTVGGRAGLTYAW